MSNGQKVLIAATILFLSFSAPNFAKTINKIKAHNITIKWLKFRPKPLNTELGDTIDKVQSVYDSNGVTLYYAVYLKPAGVVFIAPDDDIEPIIAFTDSYEFEPYDDKPLAVLLRNDMAGRLGALEEIQTSNDPKIIKHKKKVRNKWLKIDLANAFSEPSAGITVSSISDVRVEPLIMSKWGQSYECGEYCYNYYTPEHYVAGCVATSFAQVLRYFQYPTEGFGTPTPSFEIHVDGVPETRSLRGGDGSGGPYDWANMPLNPGCSTTETERQAIGALLYDCGVSVLMDYSASGSGASNYYTCERLKDTYYFDNSIYCSTGSFIMEDLIEMINPNLDAALPTILGIWTDSDEGHSIVADGYGYDLGTLYHHLNMGWTGSYDAWYNLPSVPAGYDFTTVDACLYNIFINGNGEIISGRVMSGDNPLAGVTVTATASGAGPFEAVTNDKGIYAITNVTSNKLYTVTATHPQISFEPQTASVGESEYWELDTGNVWGVDFVSAAPTPPVAVDSFAETDQDTPVIITLEATDDSLPDPPGELTYIIESLPSHASLADADTEMPIEYVPYELTTDQVLYTPCIYYDGSDVFTFAADDGGTEPDGGLSNIASLIVSVDPVTAGQALLETDFEGGIPGDWTVIDGEEDGETWMTDNPDGHISDYWTGLFCLVDSYWAGAVDMDEELITPAIDCTSASNVTLKFSHYFNHYSNEICDVDVSINYGGWQNILRYTGADASGNISEDISSLADGQPNVRVRWHYYNAYYDDYWGIDNVEITRSTSAQPSLVGDFDINCRVDIIDLELLIGDWLTESGQPGWNENCNLFADDIINAADLTVFAIEWLETQP